jgi:two-component system, OmpR family, sensor kinase
LIRLSLRTRVLAGLALVVVALVVAGIVLTATTRGHLVEQVDDRLAAAERRVAREPATTVSTSLRRHLTPRTGTACPTYEGVLHPDGELVTIFEPNLGAGQAAVPDIAIDQARAAAATGEHFTTGAVGGPDVRFRVCAFQGPDEMLLITALPLTDVDATIDRLITVEAIVGASVVAILAAVAWWVLRLGIRPIKQMTRTAERIACGDLSHRAPAAPASTEAGQLSTALNQMLERLDIAFAARAESEDRLRQFVADASHELRTPVTTIRGYAELYRVGGLHGPGELDEAMRHTEQEAVRMARLVDDLLALARLDENRSLEQRPVDLTRLVADAARDAAAVDPERPIHLELDGEVVVSGDEDRLRQVVANIVGNALVHTPAMTPVELRVTGDRGQAHVSVTDHGPGMKPEVAARITQRFYRADPARTRHRGGSGLGMSIADAAVSAHGGEIAVASEVGKGTTVTVTLPLDSPP